MAFPSQVAMGKAETPQRLGRLICATCEHRKQEMSCELGQLNPKCPAHVNREKRKLSRYDILLGKEGQALPPRPKPQEGRTVYE